MRAKRNYSSGKLAVGPGVDLSPEELAEGSSRYTNWHWGNEPARVVDVNDADMPNMLIGCGNLIRLHVRAPTSQGNRRAHPRRERDTMIEFTRAISENSFIAFDPEHPYERLYMVLDPAARRAVASRFWTANPLTPMPLAEVASLVGGKQARAGGYPRLEVKPIGVCTAVVYFTDKKGDGPSYYIHKMAEISGVFPILCCDESGRLWFAGGNYSTPDPGITD